MSISVLGIYVADLVFFGKKIPVEGETILGNNLCICVSESMSREIHITWRNDFVILSKYSSCCSMIFNFLLTYLRGDECLEKKF